MTAISDEGKAFRVCCWLDALSAHARRLADARAEKRQLEEECDELKSSGGREYVSGITYQADRIGELVVRREEEMAALCNEIGLLEQATGNAERTIREAWRANEGAADGAFKCVLERYARGASLKEAARVAGVGRYEARLSARRVAVMIYDSAPHLFTSPMGEWTTYYGFWELERRRPVPPIGISEGSHVGTGVGT